MKYLAQNLNEVYQKRGKAQKVNGKPGRLSDIILCLGGATKPLIILLGAHFFSLQGLTDSSENLTEMQLTLEFGYFPAFKLFFVFNFKFNLLNSLNCWFFFLLIQ